MKKLCTLCFHKVGYMFMHECPYLYLVQKKITTFKICNKQKQGNKDRVFAWE
jgi:hypothetical protein